MTRATIRLRLVGVALPICISVIIGAQMVVVGLKPSLLTPWAFLLFMGIYLGRFLYLRACGREAAFFATRIGQSDIDEEPGFPEWVALAGAAFLIVLTLLTPVISYKS